MSFTKHSNFNPKANFSEVKFGENMPVLEVELNEMQQIQNEARADMIRDSIHSGFVKLGDIDYEYCEQNDNQIKLSSESIAYVNGYRITIPQDTIIEIGESDKVREDLVFLEVWKEFVTNESELKEYGGEQNAGIENSIKDERYPIATSQRVALKYRIRHVADFNFSKNWVNGTSSIHPYVGWDSSTSFSPNLYAIGGDETITKPASIGAYKLFRCATFNSDTYPKFSDDNGLWVAGRNESTSLDYFKNASIDGYVYAIPMFRLKRKPNVGLASPFEYKKIHNQLDPKKFAHLVGQENVEKVHSVEIAGRTYNNHTLNTKDISLRGHGSFVGFHLQHSAVSKPLKTDTDYLFIINVKSNTLVGDNYSLDFGETDPSNSSQQSCFTSQFRLPLNALGFSTHILHTKNSFDGVYCVSRTQLSNSAKSGNIVFDYMIIEYSPELVDIDFIPYFEGVKSLGELTNNSITVENNLVEEGTYVHELQNHILPTHPEVTHVSWGEDVVIPPEVEIELKRGEELLQTITQLPIKLETTGEEKLHVKSMKGRTLVNVLKDSGKDLIISPNTNTPLKTQYLLNTSKKYFVKIFLHSADNVVNESDRCFKIQWFNASDYNGYRNVSYQELKNGVGFIIPPYDGDIEDAFKNNPHIAIWHTNQGVQGNVKISFMCLEYQEGMENWGLKYFEGMKSVEEPNIKVFGANLVDTQLAYVNKKYSNDSCWSVIKTKGNSVTSMASGVTSSNDYRGFGVSIPVYTVKPNTTYVLKSKLRENNVEVTSQMFVYCNSRTWGNAISTGVDKIQFTTPSDCEYLTLGLGYCLLKNGKVIEVYDIELIELDYADNDYSSQSPTRLNTPKGTVLRSLNSSLFDSIDFDSGFIKQNIDELTMNGSLEQGYWILNQQIASGYQYTWRADTIDLSSKTALVLCDTLVSSKNESTLNCIWAYLGTHIVVHSPIDNLNTFKDNLKNKPLTVLYLKSSPITKKIGLSEDDYVGKSKITYQLAEPLNYIPGGYFDEIKGDKLIKRTGVITFDGSSNEKWSIAGEFNSYGAIQIPHMKKNSKLFTNLLPQVDMSSALEDNPIGVMATMGEPTILRLRPFDRNNITLDEITSWLNASPLTVIFELANPIEIPLKEVSPLDVDFSLNRQFKRGYENCLKELPSGVKDVVENGKVKRILGFTKLNGSESWTQHSHSNDTHLYVTCLLSDAIDNGNNINTLTNMFEPTTLVHSSTYMGEGYYLNGRTIQLRILKSRLNTPDLSGFKSWLQVNPLCVLYELSTPTTEELTEENCRYVPYMPLNSYVGSLYVADGINQTKFLTAFSPSEYEVQTYHRYFSNEFNVFEDIKRKKSPYGHKTYLEEVEGKYVEKFIAGLEKHEIEDLRHKVSLTGFDYNHLLQDSFLKLIKGELS